jgi:hypothetical protein
VKKPQIRAMWARKAARGDRGLQMPNPRTAPLGVILVAGLPTAQAIEAVGALDTPAVIEQAIRAEGRCMARSAVLEALKARLAVRRRAERINAEAQREEKLRISRIARMGRVFNAEAQRRGGRKA